jgi:hypothetical protein
VKKRTSRSKVLTAVFIAALSAALPANTFAQALLEGQKEILAAQEEGLAPIVVQTEPA